MFSMSLKSVPDCLVSIAPRLIGVPAALTPGFVPHEEIATVPEPDAVEELDADVDAGADADELAGAALLELEVELELHAARTPSDSAATTAAAVRVRQWTDLFMCSAFSWLTASHSSFRTGSRSASQRSSHPG
jgi:hypothetical protein